MRPPAAVPESGSPFRLRREPTQQRARETFNHILEVAAELLNEKGFDDFNTNLLAERAKVGVRAIYRYFPNKHALVVELARRMAAEWRADLEDDDAFADPTSNWRTVWCGYLDRFVANVHATTGGVAVLRAMRSHPQLRAVDDAVNALYMTDVAQALRARCPAIDPAEAATAAKALLTTTVAMVDASIDESTDQERRLLDALKTMHLAYLSRWLGPGP